MKALVAQGGGPTAVINQSLAGVVLEARRFSNIESVYGACHGVAGISPENIVDLGQETTQQIELVAAMPGSALGSTRDKPDTLMCWPLQHDPPLTFSSSSSRNSRTCVAQPSFELSLLLLMFFSIKTGEWIIQSLVQRHWINALAATVTPVTFFNHA